MSLTEAQLAIRRTGLTAGDLRAITRKDPYGRGPHDVFRSKVLGEDTVESTEAMELGDAMEPIAIRKLAEKRGLYVMRRDPQSLTIRHPERSIHVATPDAFLATTAFHEPEALGEAKVVGFHNASGWGQLDDEIPDWCLIQVTWQMHVARIPVCIVGALIGTEVRTYRVELDTELEGVLVEEADRFWRDYVQPRRPPEIDGSESSGRMLRALFPRATGPVVRASEEVEKLAKTYFAEVAALNAAKEAVETTKQLLIAACGVADGIVGNGWRLKYSMRKGYDVAAHHVNEGRRFDMRTVDAKTTPNGRRAA